MKSVQESIFTFAEKGITSRCALTLELELVNGFRLTKVFLPGGKNDDRKSLWFPGIRRAYLRYLIEVLRPDVIGGDWNSDPDFEKERRSFFEAPSSSSYLEMLFGED